MLLTLSLPHSWTLLPLLLTNLLLGSNMASNPVCYMWSDRCHMSFSDHVSQAVTLSRESRDQVTDMFIEFEKQYIQNLAFNDRILNCHMTRLAVPENEEQAPQEKHLVEEMGRLQGAPAAVLSNATETEENQKGLQEGVRKLIRRVEDKTNKNYPSWSGLEFLQSDNEDTCLFALYTLFQCLIRDSEVTTTHLKHLKCQMDPYSEC